MKGIKSTETVFATKATKVTQIPPFDHSACCAGRWRDVEVANTNGVGQHDGLCSRFRRHASRLSGVVERLVLVSSVFFVAEYVFVSFVANSVFVSLVAAQTQVIAEILVHGNHTTPDTEILATAGLAVGDPADASRLAEAERKLRDSGRFEAVEVRRRYRSINNPDEVLIILLVDERARNTGMWMPLVAYRDGYGATYGARVTFMDPLGPRTRISAPVTWGGERRAAGDVERSFRGGPFSTVGGTASIHRRVNPHFNVPDTRREVAVHADRAVTRWLRAGADAHVSHVTFGDNAPVEWHRAAGAHVGVDTRLDPSFPRNAFHATTGWERIAFRRPPLRQAQGIPSSTRDGGLGLPGNAQRLRADVRGYVGVGGPVVLALRAQAVRASASLPLSEQALLGGSDSLRGYRAGHRAGDSLTSASAEVRLPLTSPLTSARFGVKVFADAGTAWNAGARLVDQRFDHGIGGGIYIGAAVVTANVDVAWPERGKARVHVQLGIGK